MEALKLEISRITVGFDKVNKEMSIFVYCHKEGSFKVSLHLFENRTLSELWILRNKVSRSSELNELLRDHLRDVAMNASPQIVHLPYQVKYYSSTSLQSCNLDDKSITKYHARQLIKIELMLRTSGFASQEKVDVANMIQAYCKANVKIYD